MSDARSVLVAHRSSSPVHCAAPWDFVPLRDLWFIMGTLLRDMAALNKDELLPWDVWGAHPKLNATLAADELALGDRLAGLTRDPDSRFEALSALYRGDDRVRVPGKVFNALMERLEAA